jgi:dihydrofolate synthase / folylpolyglutamate synthase
VNYDEALAALDAHANYERTGRIESPSLDKMSQIMELMGNPQLNYPVIHVTGTNGKGSTVAMITALLMEQGLRVGTLTSPHLHRINERMAHNAKPIDDESFARMITDCLILESMMTERLSYFELVTAAGLRWFDDEPVDVAVVEVGMLGRWDATNVVEADVAVITNVGMDHNDYAGPTRAHIAYEKAGIIKPKSTVVVGETDEEIAAIFTNSVSTALWQRDVDFECLSNDLAVGGRLVELRTPAATYPDVFVSLNGRHQGLNASLAVAAVEAFFDGPLDAEVLNEALGAVKMPGRCEVLSHHPLTIVDGAHNPAGAEAFAEALDEDFDVAGERIYVVGFLGPRDPEAMLRALGTDGARRVICCTPPSARAIPAADVHAAAEALGLRSLCIPDAKEACDMAMSEAAVDDIVIITGSLYLVGTARNYLRR